MQKNTPLDKIFIEKFIPYYIGARQKHFKNKISGIKGLLFRISGNDKYYNSLFIDEATLVEVASLYIEEKITYGRNVSDHEWDKTICSLKNAAETLYKRNSFISEYKKFFVSLTTLAIIIFTFLPPTIPIVTPEALKAIIAATLAFLVIFTIIEADNNKYFASIYIEAASICDYLKKKQSSG